MIAHLDNLAGVPTPIPPLGEAEAALLALPHACHRVDRLRLAGNAVVPAQAAHAWRVLDARLRAILG